MKKSKGFTLIELLGVIVILAVIMVIAVPKIIDVIEKAEMQAFKESVELMAHTAVVQYEANVVKGETKKIPEEGISYIYEANEQINIEEVGLLNFKGDKPLSGTITLTKEKKTKIIEVVSKNGKWCAVKSENEKGATVGKATELGCAFEEEVKDKKPCEMEKETVEGVKVHYIDSASDLYAFSQSVNSGTSYEGEKIVVRNNLDMSKAQGTCVTTFDPIGTSTNPFKGTFEGGAKKISNLTINKPNQDYVGLFGYVNNATIYATILDNVTVTGRNYVGVLTGYANSSKVQEIQIDNMNLTGNAYIGSTIGSWASSTANNILVKNGTITSTVPYPYNDVYGGFVVGYSSAKNSIVENVQGSSRSGYCISYGSRENEEYLSEKTNWNGGKSDVPFSESGINDISFYEAAGLDTYIGGDDDAKSDSTTKALAGYYFDYDNSGEITLKKVKDNTFKLTMKKDKNNYYQITSEAEWKQASAHLSEKYKLTKDLNFSSNKYYMLGSEHNPFTGLIDGNDKMISNVTISATPENMVGMFGKTEGATIKGLKLQNINTLGYTYVGSIIGHATSTTCYGISLNNIVVNAKNNNVGGAFGYLSSSNVSSILLDNINVTGYAYIGGTIGSWTSSTADNILVKNGTITSIVPYPSNDVYGGFVVGYASAKNSIVENVQGTATSSYYISYGNRGNEEYISEKTSWNGYNADMPFSEAGIGDINFYEAAGLDTYIGGDNDSDGYYFDYESPSSNNIVLKRVSEDPITFTLSGSGTSSAPYIIDSEQKWKEATTKLNAVYKIEENLNFSNNHYYMMGSEYNSFKGTIIGNDKKISNVQINANQENCVGLFGQTNGATIYALKLDNINTSGYTKLGSLIGNAISSTIYAIAIDHVKVTGLLSNVGGVAGYLNSSSLYEVAVDNINITGYTYIGGAIGNWTSSTANNILVKNGTITSTVPYPSNDVYGGFLIGYASASNSIVENVQGSAVSAYYIAYGPYTSENVTWNGNPNFSGTFSASNINNLSYYSGKIETAYQGDKNNTGYFFDYDDSHNGKVWLVKAYTSTSSSNLSVDSSSTVTYTNPSCSEQTAPTCELKSMQILSNGFTPLVECTDDTQIESFRSYFDSRTSKAAEAYEDIGNDKSNISWSNSNKTIIYNGTWRTTNKTGPWPKSGVCYYFRYGAKDTCGNYSTYVSDSCFSF